MRRSLLGMVVVMASCGSPAAVSTTAPPQVGTLPVVTTIPETLAITITGCSAPPVPFSTLCEVFDLIEGNHFSPPDRATMAAAAIDGARLAVGRDTADLPRSLHCAVPSVEFEGLCPVVAARMEDSAIPIGDLIYGAVNSMLAGSVDPYTLYLPPEMSGVVGEDGILPGVGMVVAPLNAAGSPCVRVEAVCPLEVVTVLPGSAADQAGMLAGDLVRAVDGQLLVGLTLVDVSALLAGDPGTTVRLDLERGGSSLQATVTRTDAGPLPVVGEMVGNVGYLRIPEFGLDTHIVFHGWLQNLITAGARRLVLDLRDNPGGFLFSVSIIGSEFVSSGLLYKTQSRFEDLDYPAVDGGIATRLPLVVLVNGGSASAAEILAAALQERGRASVVGTATFGKNLVQAPFELRNGGILRVSIATWTTPSGASVAGTGVVPDLNVELEPELTAAELVELSSG
ncbi:MAG: S41 family peptidase [Actinomycetota bacterium]